MIEINPNESTILNFKIDVSGSNEIPKPRLFIPISDKGISLVFEGKMNDNEVEVNISELLDLTDSKKLKGKLEVVVEGNVFYPWEDTIEIKSVPKVRAESVEPIVTESKVKVTAKTTTEKVEPLKIKKKNLGDMFSEKL